MVCIYKLSFQFIIAYSVCGRLASGAEYVRVTALKYTQVGEWVYTIYFYCAIRLDRGRNRLQVGMSTY